MTHFPFSVDVPVRGYEVDAFHHVNNAVYLNWLEHARWELGQVGGFPGWDAHTQPVVRHVELDYQHEVVLGDVVRVTLWPRRAGNTSFTLGCSMRIVQSKDPARVGSVALLATTVIVVVRVDGGGKMPLPEAWRQVFPESDPGPQPPV